MIGEVIGNYEIVQQIGKGGMGAVYVGQHTLLGRRAAIKVLLPMYSVRPEIVNRFFNEARAVTAINNPGIVQVFDFGYHGDGSAFIVMELLDGDPMDRRLRKAGRFGVVEALRLVRMICTSLGAAHAAGVVHRDLKPENLFIVRDLAVVGGERAKVLDFGIAKLSADDGGAHETRAGTLMGTPMYMSPEQCRHAGEVDQRSDIYAMGCVMYTMLTGRPPFDGSGTGDLIVAHLQTPPPLVSARVAGMPAAIDAIVQRCLAKTPDERFASMAEMVWALDAAEVGLQQQDSLGPVASLAQPVMPALPVMPTTLSSAFGEPTLPRRSRGRLARGLIGTLAVGVGIGVGALAVSRARRAPPIEAPSRIEAAPAKITMPVTLPAVAAVAVDAGAAPIDAAVARVAPPEPATAAPPKQTRRPSPSPTRKGDHAKPTTPLPFDRGD